MPSGPLAFATRRVDLMAANMRAPFWLSVWMADHSPPPPHKAWENLTRWWFEFKERLPVARDGLDFNQQGQTLMISDSNNFS